MYGKIIIVYPMIILLALTIGCNSSDEDPTAKDALENWRNQDFSENEPKSTTPKNTSDNYPSETPSGSIECPIQILDYRQQIEGTKLYIEGNVYNYGDSSYKNPKITCVKLYILFYNKNSEVIGEDSYYLDVGELSYGEKYPFSASANIRSGAEMWNVKVRCCTR